MHATIVETARLSKPEWDKDTMPGAAEMLTIYDDAEDVTIEAVHYQGSTTQARAITDWAEGGEYAPLSVQTRDMRPFEVRMLTQGVAGDRIMVRPGNWVTKDNRGTVRVYRDSQFQRLYREELP